MKRGEEAFNRLKDLVLYKMNLPENVAKGWPNPSDDNIFLARWRLMEEVEELSVEILDKNYDAAKLEIADVVAYCAILLDLIDQKEKHENTTV